MSLLFEQKYRYIVFEPVDSVRSQLMSILKTPWYDLTVNLTGNVSKDNTFKISPKFSLGIEVFGVVQSFSVITGRIETEGERTHINVQVRPNHSVLLAFYLILLIFLFNVIGLFSASTESDWILVTVLFVMVILLRSLIHFSMGRLKNRFERTMAVHPED